MATDIGAVCCNHRPAAKGTEILVISELPEVVERCNHRPAAKGTEMIGERYEIVAGERLQSSTRCEGY